MATSEPLITLAAVTRQRMCAQVGMVLPKISQDIRDHLSKQLEHARMAKDIQSARDGLEMFTRFDRVWIDRIRASLQQQLAMRGRSALGGSTSLGRLELLATEAVEDQLVASKLALDIQDKAGQEWTDLRLRLLFAEGKVELASSDIARPESLAKVMVDEWVHAGMSRESWLQLQSILHKTMSEKLVEVFHEANRFLVTNGVMPDVELRGGIRKAPVAPTAEYSSTMADTLAMASQSSRGTANASTAFAKTAHAVPIMGGQGAELWSKARAQATEVVGRLKRLLSDRVGEGSVSQGHAPSPALNALLQEGRLRGFSQVPGDHGEVTIRLAEVPIRIEDAVLQVRQQSAELKDAANTPTEKAIIEVVALMFQSILNEDRIPPTLRIWFARLQIPVLRVALAEPDFFSSLQHPARRLIDRMGSCALGFEATLSDVSAQALEKEIKRVVQVIEQYPETGRRVFQLVYDEFQKFLARHLQEQGQAGRLATVAQQVEQKETLSVQYTIELRKQLNDMPVRDEIREFFFKVWADVLAVATIKHGPKHYEMTDLKKMAHDLLWAASAKPTRGERTQVIAQLPTLLARLRKGMGLLGLDQATQDKHIKVISDVLAQAFMSRTEPIPAAQLEAMTKNLSNLEDFLPEEGVGDLDLDQESIELITGVDASRIEVIADGGKPADDAMKAWARELQLGNWFNLDHNGSMSQVQLAWRSNRGQLCMFTTATQRYFLMQTGRVASYLQSGLIKPVDEEALTVRATRMALEKLDANPERLFN